MPPICGLTTPALKGTKYPKKPRKTRWKIKKKNPNGHNLVRQVEVIYKSEHTFHSEALRLSVSGFHLRNGEALTH